MEAQWQIFVCEIFNEETRKWDDFPGYADIGTVISYDPEAEIPEEYASTFGLLTVSDNELWMLESIPMGAKTREIRVKLRKLNNFVTIS
jgi:hypothetical protein